jgi:CheY-like chemotaxis protein
VLVVKPTVLVVDDNAINRNLLEIIFRTLGWQATLSEDGESALAHLRTTRFDLVLLDLRMPGLSGHDVCIRIRTELGLADLPVIAYTAHGMVEDRERMLACGFNGMLIKPVSIADVRSVCEDYGPRAL